MTKTKEKRGYLAFVSPEVSKEWNYAKNDANITPYEVHAGSNKKYWWKCKKGHEWEARVASRVEGSKCPYCAGRRVCEDNCLATLYPDVAAQWHPTKNEKTPHDVTAGTNKKAWWVCDKGHEWEARISDRTSGKGCPYCSGNKLTKERSLAVVNPEVAKSWHPTKNGDKTPDQVSCGSAEKAWWVCDKGHEWEAKIFERNRRTGCPYCAGKRVAEERSLAAINPEVAKLWHPTKNGEKTPHDVTYGSVKKYWWICSNGEEIELSVKNMCRRKNK